MENNHQLNVLALDCDETSDDVNPEEGLALIDS